MTEGESLEADVRRWGARCPSSCRPQTATWGPRRATHVKPSARLERRMMQAVIGDARLRAALFRFVDVRPACTDSRRARPPPARVPRRGRRIGHGTTPVVAGRAALAPAADGIGRRARRQRDVAPVHRRRRCRRLRVPSSRRCGNAGAAPPSTCSARRRSPTPRATPTPRAAPTLCGCSATTSSEWPPTCAARARRARTAAAREPVRQGLGADAAPARQRAATRRHRRRRATAAARCCAWRASSAPTCTSTWSRSTRASGITRARARAARRARVRATARRPGSCCRPT